MGGRRRLEHLETTGTQERWAFLGCTGGCLAPESAGMGGAGAKSLPQTQAYSHGAFRPQIKVEEDFGFEADEALDSSWVSREPDKLLPYPTLASPPFD